MLSFGGVLDVSLFVAALKLKGFDSSHTRVHVMGIGDEVCDDVFDAFMCVDCEVSLLCARDEVVSVAIKSWVEFAIA